MHTCSQHKKVLIHNKIATLDNLSGYIFSIFALYNSNS